MENKELLEYMKLMDKDFDMNKYQYDFVCNSAIKIKDIYLKLYNNGLSSYYTTRICFLICANFKEKDLKILEEILYKNIVFRLNHFNSNESNLRIILDDMLAKIIKNTNILELDNDLRKITGVKSINLDGLDFFTNWSAKSSQNNKIYVNINTMSTGKIRMLGLRSRFDLLRNGRIEHKELLGVGFKDNNYTLLNNQYSCDNIFNYIVTI